MPPDNPSLERFGREVARLRRDADMTQEALARRLGVSSSHLSDIERGSTEARPRIRSALDEVLGSGGRLERLWSELTGSGRQAWLYEVTELTHGADALYEYQSLVFPGYLQTEDYARALITYGSAWLTADQAAAKAKERATRAKHMAEAAAPMIWLVIDQTILWRRYGSPAIQREQLAHVAELVDRNRLTLQMVPVDSPRHAGTSGPMRVIARAENPDVVFMESAHEGQVITSSVDVGRRRMAFAALQGIARGPDETLRELRKEMQRIDDE